MKNWYYTDTLWHKPIKELEKHKPSEKQMYRWVDPILGSTVDIPWNLCE